MIFHRLSILFAEFREADFSCDFTKFLPILQILITICNCVGSANMRWCFLVKICLITNCSVILRYSWGRFIWFWVNLLKFNPDKISFLSVFGVKPILQGRATLHILYFWKLHIFLHLITINSFAPESNEIEIWRFEKFELVYTV